MTLSRRQQDVLAFMRDYTARYGEPPSVRQIGGATGLGTTSAVIYQLQQLELRGLVRKLDGARSPWRPVEKDHVADLLLELRWTDRGEAV